MDENTALPLREPTGSRLERRDRRSDDELAVPFIVGTGRCGSTLLRLMLDAHPCMAIPPETHFVPVAIQASEGAAAPREAFLDAMTGHQRWKSFQLDDKQLRQRVEQISPFDPGEVLREFYRMYARGAGKSRWGDKTPTYLGHMPLIEKALPEARFVHIIRDGRDVALSIRELWFGPSTIPEIAEWWVAHIERARRDARSLPHYMEIRHEDLVQQPESTLRRICEFLHLPWHGEMLDYHRRAAERLQAAVASDTPDQAQRRLSAQEFAAQPLQSSRLERWRREMATSELAEFETVAGGLLAELGYELACNPGDLPAHIPWFHRFEFAMREIADVVPAGASVVLLDEGRWAVTSDHQERSYFPLTQYAGSYAGPPAGGREAIEQLRQRQLEGADYLVVAWESLWWLECYPELDRHLHERWEQIWQSNNVRIYRASAAGQIDATVRQSGRATTAGVQAQRNFS